MVVLKKGNPIYDIVKQYLELFANGELTQPKIYDTNTGLTFYVKSSIIEIKQEG